MDIKGYGRHLLDAAFIGIRWIILGVISGILVGAVSAEFALGIQHASLFRERHAYIIWLLPLSGIFIVGFYHFLGVSNPKGTNLVLSSLRDGEPVPGRMAPLIILSTILTHLFGGSAGREGAALQVGGSLGNLIGNVLHIKKEDRRTVIICGMSAAFSALFGTPLAAAIMSLEISTVGIMYYTSLVPAVISALTAQLVAVRLGAHGEHFLIPEPPAFSLAPAASVIAFSLLCALVSVLFCTAMHKSKKLFTRSLPNPHLRVLASSAIIIALTLIVGSQTYNGTGSGIIESLLMEPGYTLPKYAFLLKIIFTAVTLSGGFQGGEIVPSLFIGAALGNAVAPLTGFDPSFLSALGMCGVFCGVSNCPMTALLISFELFGFSGSSYFMIAVAISYLFSGNYGLYAQQKILYSKLSHTKVDSFAH